MALFYDWCYDQLTDAERALIRKSLVDKGVDGLLKAVPHYGASGWPNGYAVLTSALGICGVTLQGEEPQAETWVIEATACAKEFFDTQGKDGGCMEGPGYGTYGADTLACFMLALESANVPHELLEHPFFATLPRYCISQMCPNDKRHTGFGDCWSSQPFPLCMTLLALRGNADAVWYLHEIGYVKGEAADAYNPANAGANTRLHFWRSGQPGGFARIEGPNPHAYSFVLHTLGGIEVTGSNSAVLTTPGSARLETHVFSPSGITLTATGNRPIRRGNGLCRPQLLRRRRHLVR